MVAGGKEEARPAKKEKVAEKTKSEKRGENVLNKNVCGIEGREGCDSFNSRGPAWRTFLVLLRSRGEGGEKRAVKPGKHMPNRVGQKKSSRKRKSSGSLQMQMEPNRKSGVEGKGRDQSRQGRENSSERGGIPSITYRECHSGN